MEDAPQIFWVTRELILEWLVSQVILNEATWRIIFNDPCIREMEFGDAYDNIPLQVVQTLPGKEFQMKNYDHIDT